jgi:dolichol-phosphate mannosyltransferase
MQNHCVLEQARQSLTQTRMNLNLPRTEISVVVPVFNEEGNVELLAEEIVQSMDAVGRAYEIVFIDDASTDQTWEKIRAAQQLHPQVRGIKHERNGGQSAALWTGIEATTSPIIVTMDGDRQNDPADLPQLLSALDDCDFVCGVRRERHDDWLRRASTKVARAARRRVLKVDFCDTGCAFRAFRREALRGVFPFNGVHRFMPVLVHANGIRTKEIPICHRARVAGESKYGMWDRLWRGIYDLIAISWYQKRRLSKINVTELPRQPVAMRAEQRHWRNLEIRTTAPEFQPVEPG